MALMEQETSRPNQGIHLHNLVSWFQHSCPSCDFQRPNYQQCTRSPLTLSPSLESRRAVPCLLTTFKRLRPYRPASCRSPPLNFFYVTLQRFQAESEERVTLQFSAAASAQLPTEKITVASKCVLSATPAWFFRAAENKEAPLLTNARHFGAAPGGSEMLRKWD